MQNVTRHTPRTSKLEIPMPNWRGSDFITVIVELDPHIFLQCEIKLRRCDINSTSTYILTNHNSSITALLKLICRVSFDIQCNVQVVKFLRFRRSSGCLCSYLPLQLDTSNLKCPGWITPQYENIPTIGGLCDVLPGATIILFNSLSVRRIERSLDNRTPQ